MFKYIRWWVYTILYMIMKISYSNTLIKLYALS